MGEIRSQDKRDKLRLLYTKVTQQTNLSKVLMAALAECDAAVGTGSFVNSTSEAGGSVSFTFLSEYSPVIARRLIGELLDVYETQKAALGGTPTDAQIYTAMMTALKPVREFQTDYTFLRSGPGAML